MEGSSGKKLLLYLLPELGCMALAGAMIWFANSVGALNQGEDRMLCHMVLVLLGVGIVGFSVRSGVVKEALDYNNGQHIMRFWLCFLMSLCVACFCAFLPAAAWPFLPIFVLLALFSNLGTGVLAGAVLLALPVCLAGAGVEVYLLYLISGVLGAVFFQRMRNEFKTILPILFSLACLLVCLTAGTILTANARLSWEAFVVPVVNLIISGILLFGILKYFFTKIIYVFRDRYLDLNDTENPTLTELREKDRDVYLKSIHTAYFCERIASRLEFNTDALKCAAYYYRMPEEIFEKQKGLSFPPEVVRILTDYRGYREKKGALHLREAAVLMASDDVITRVLSLLAEKSDKPIDYDGEIEAIFQRYYETGVFHQCDITVRELTTMKKIFREEKLYYDFLH